MASLLWHLMVQPRASGSLGCSVLLLLSAPPLGQAMGERMLVATRLESAAGSPSSTVGALTFSGCDAAHALFGGHSPLGEGVRVQKTTDPSRALVNVPGAVSTSTTNFSTLSRGHIEHVETAGAGGAPLPASNTEPLAAQQRQTSSSTLPAVGGSAIFCATPRTETSTVAIEARALCSWLGGGGGGATPNARSTHRPALGAEDFSRWAAPKLQSRI